MIKVCTNECSLARTFSFIRSLPVFIEIEIKIFQKPKLVLSKMKNTDKNRIKTDWMKAKAQNILHQQLTKGSNLLRIFIQNWKIALGRESWNIELPLMSVRSKRSYQFTRQPIFFPIILMVLQNNEFDDCNLLLLLICINETDIKLNYAKNVFCMWRLLHWRSEKLSIESMVWNPYAFFFNHDRRNREILWAVNGDLTRSAINGIFFFKRNQINLKHVWCLLSISGVHEG